MNNLFSRYCTQSKVQSNRQNCLNVCFSNRLFNGTSKNKLQSLFSIFLTKFRYSFPEIIIIFFILENATPNRFDLNIILYIRSFSIDIFNLKWVCGLLSITYIMWLSDSNRFSHFRWRSSFRLIAIVLNGGKKNWILDCKLHPSMHVTTQYIM